MSDTDKEKFNKSEDNATIITTQSETHREQILIKKIINSASVS